MSALTYGFGSGLVRSFGFPDLQVLLVRSCLPQNSGSEIGPLKFGHAIFPVSVWLWFPGPPGFHSKRERVVVLRLCFSFPHRSESQFRRSAPFAPRFWCQFGVLIFSPVAFPALVSGAPFYGAKDSGRAECALSVVDPVSVF